MKVLLIVDKYNWAYDSIAQNLLDCNPFDWDIKIMAVKKDKKKIQKKYKKYDFFFVMGWQNYDAISFLPKNKTLVGVHSFHSWDGKKSFPGKEGKPTSGLIDKLNTFLGVNTVSNKLADAFKDAGAVCTRNGVNTEVFKPLEIKPEVFKAGYSGTIKHDWRKRITSIIIPAAEKARVPYHLAMRKHGSYVPMAEMPEFYQKLGCYLCASKSEGFSLSVLEAASCGIPVISTKVSGCVTLIDHGVNGFLVEERNEISMIEEFSCHIDNLRHDKKLRAKISHNIRKTIEDEYSWEERSKDWFTFMEKKFNA